jgi:hypothetical protein
LIFAANLRATMSATTRRDSTDMDPRFISVRSHDARSRQRSALVLTRAGVARMIASHDLDQSSYVSRDQRLAPQQSSRR